MDTGTSKLKLASRINALTRKEPPQVKLMMRFYIMGNRSCRQSAYQDVQPHHLERALELCSVFRRRWPNCIQ